MRSPQKQSADQGVRNGEFMEAIIALDEVDENLALCLLNLIPARRAASDTIRCTSRGSGARWVRLLNGTTDRHRPSARTDVLGFRTPTHRANPFITSTQQALCLHHQLDQHPSTIAIADHPRLTPSPPTPNPRGRPEPPDRPATSSASLSIPQLLPPRRRHRPDPGQLTGLGDTRFQSEPPWGQEPMHRIINGLAPPVKRYVLKYSSALASGSE